MTLVLTNDKINKILFCDRVLATRTFDRISGCEITTSLILVNREDGVDWQTVLPVTDEGINYNGVFYRRWSCYPDNDKNFKKSS